MEEAIQKQNDNDLVGQNEHDRPGEKRGCKTTVRAVMKNGCSLVRSGPSCSLRELEPARQTVFGEACVMRVTKHNLELRRVLNDDGQYSMIDLKSNLLKNTGLKMTEGRYLQFEMEASAYDSGYIAANLTNVSSNEVVFLQRSSFQFLKD